MASRLRPGDDGEDTNDVEQQINGVGVAVLIGFLKDGRQPTIVGHLQQGITEHAQTAQSRACNGTDAAADHEEYIQCIGEDGPCGHTDVLASSLSVGENTTGNDAHGTVDHGQQQGNDDDAQRDGTLGILGDSGHRDGSHRSALAGKTHHGQSGDETSETAVEEAAVSAGKGAGKINLGNAENNKQCKRSYQNQSNDVFQNGDEAGTLDGGKEK